MALCKSLSGMNIAITAGRDSDPAIEACKHGCVTSDISTSDNPKVQPSTHQPWLGIHQQPRVNRIVRFA